jgi:Sulfatase-modifying factor enzyme 1/SAM domain (Sterile alpha motif)
MNGTLQKVLTELGLWALLPLFESQDIDDSVLNELTDSDLKEIGVDKLGTRKKILIKFSKSSDGEATGPVVEESSALAPSSAPSKTTATPAELTKDSPWVNTLGMPFVPIPRLGTLFCIWLVRVQDYEAHCMASGAKFPACEFPQGPDHPIVNVSWEDALEFCVWLTGKERAEGKIYDNTAYRLPTDLEWSAAVGLPHEAEATPAERSGKILGYPWGLRWPPPKGSGNYGPSLEVDSFEHTSPVGSFPANAFGLHDMGGNVWDWCMDWHDSDQKYRVVRGASWSNSYPEFMLSSFRFNYFNFYPDFRYSYFGFRCVLAGCGNDPWSAMVDSSCREKLPAEGQSDQV